MRNINQLNTFAIHTLGCKVNTYESQSIINQLVSSGLVQVSFNQVADIYIINTCSVTNTADAKSRNMILRARKLSPNAIIIVAGCYSQVAHKTLSNKLNIDIIIGNKYKNNIIKLIEQYLNQKKQIVKVDNLLLENKYEHLVESSFVDRTRAFLKIQDGCNFMCSYCIIPFARGKQRSKPLEVIINEIKNFIKKGFKEIVLSGVNTAGYLDAKGNDFYALLKTINDIKGKFRIRISSLEPFQITDQIIDLITTNQQRFCSHWHICLQSGCNHVLQDMNRKYTINDFVKLVNKIREKDPLASISTDYIAGFPTETDEDHKLSLSNVNKINFSFMHVFTYSKRSFTPASKLKDIHGTIKKQRTNEAISLSNDMYKKYLSQFIDKEVEVLFETCENNLYMGKSSQYFDVILKSDVDLSLNQFYRFRVDKIINNKAILKLSN